MDDRNKTKSQLLAEIRELRNQIADNSKSDADSVDMQRALNTERTIRSIIDASQALIAMVDRDGIITECNQVMLDRFGKKREEIVGTYVWDLFPKDVADKRKALTEEVFRTGEPGHLEDNRNGIWNESTINPIFNDAGEVTHVTVIAHDITNHKKAEIDRLENEQYLQAILQTTADGFWTLDTNGDILDVNEAYCRMSGFTRDQLLSMNISEIDVLEEHQDVLDHIEKIMTFGTDTFDTKHRKKDGTVYDVEITVTYLDRDGGRLICFSRDITQRKQNELLLKKSEENLRQRNEFIETIINNLPIGLAANRISDQQVVFINPAFEKIYGWPKELFDSIGHFFEHVYPDPEYRGQLAERVMADIMSGDPERMIWDDLTATGQDGSHKFIKGQNIPLPEHDLMISTVLDVTTRKQAEDRLRASEARNRAILEAIPDMIFIMNKDGVHEDFYAPMLESLFVKPEDILGKNVEDVLPEEAGTLIKNHIQETLNGSLIQIFEYHLEFPDGVRYYDCRMVPLQEDNVLAIVRDITAQKHIEDALRDSEEKYRALYENAPLSYQSLDENGCFLDVNPTWLKTLGYEREEVIGKCFGDFLHPDWKPHFETNFPAFKKRGYVHDVEFRIRHKSGHYRDIIFEGCIGYHPDGSFRQTYCVFKDITEQKQAEQKLRETTLHLQQAIQAGRVGLWDWDIISNTVYYSPEWKQQIGYEDHEISNDFKEWEKRVHPDDIDNTLKRLQECVENRAENYSVEFRFRHKDGSYRWILAQGSVSEDENGQPVRMLGSHIDITDRKEVDAQLAESEQKYRTYVENSPEGIFIADAEGRYIDVNAPACHMTGYTRLELLSMSILDLVSPQMSQIGLETFEKLKETGAFQFELSLRKKDGSDFIAFLNTVAIGNNHYMAFCKDITARKIAEKKLQENERALREAQKMAHMGNWWWDVQTGDVVWSEEVYHIFGMDPTDFKPNIDSIMERSPWPEEHERDKELIEKAIASHEQGAFEQRFLRADNTGGWYYSSFQGVYDNKNELVAIKGTVQDITERKQAEQALRESEEKYRDMFEGMISGMGLHEIVYDGDGRPIDYITLNVNAAFEQLLGVSRDEIIGKRAYETVSDLDREWLDIFGSVAETGQPRKYEQYASNLGKWFSGTAFSTKKGTFAVTFVDVTKEKRAQIELSDKTHTLETIFRNAPYIMMLVNDDGRVRDINHAGSKFASRKKEQLLNLLGGEVFKCMNSVNGAGCGQNEECKDCPVRSRVKHTLKTGEPLFEQPGTLSVLKDGETVTLHLLISTTMVVMSDEKLVLVTIADISDRVEAENALQESEAVHRALVGGLPDIILRFDREGRHLFVSENVTKVVDIEAEAFIGKTHRELGFPEEQCQFWEDAIRHVFTSGVIYETEFRVEGRRGQTIFDWRLVPEFDTNGNVQSVLTISRDVTAQRQVEQNYQMLFDEMLDGFAVHQIICDDNGKPVDYRFLGVNPAFEALTGLKNEDIRGKTVREVLPGIEQSWIDTYGRVALNGEPTQFENYTQEMNRYYQVAAFNNAPGQFACIFIDITERKLAEQELLRQQRIITLNNRIANVFLTTQSDKIFTDVLDIILDALVSRYGIFGYIDDSGNLVCPTMTRDIWDQCEMPDKEILFPCSVWGGIWGKSLREKCTVVLNEGLTFPAGHIILDNAMAVAIVHHDELIGQFVVANKPGGYNHDDQELLENAASQTAPVLHALLERTRQQEVQEKLEQQLRQAQKMEAVGRLAGGVAHDFNNMLNVILGNTELAMGEISEDEPVYEDLKEIYKATERSANLTRQLLAFARKQTIKPQVLDLNKIIEGMLTMLRRLIGEDISLEWIPGNTIWPVEVDPSQLDQILANLCVNARDAINDVGRITIETSNVMSDESYSEEHPEAKPGDYVMLAVSDNGQGMDEETRAKAFEPFFTTKHQGQGTGLGLATVYGIIKQNDGFINLYSEEGQGTTIKIYLPRFKGKAEQLVESGAAHSAGRGHETILLVEDEQALLRLGIKTLEQYGYRVLAAGSPGEAIALASEYGGVIHLLITDVVMPEMNGRELAQRIMSMYPDIECLFMSGYTANVIAHRGVLDKGVQFIQKPYSKSELAAKVREIIDKNR